MPFQDFQNIFSFSITSGEVITNLVIALISGLLISFFYIWTYRGPNYSSRFVHSLVIITMITSIVILVIGNNLARAFGLVGAMSIIRFRTAVKDSHDIVFIFFALATGLAAGVGLHQIALTGVIFIGIVLLLLYQFDYGSSKKREYLLQFSYSANGDIPPPYTSIIEDFCKQSKLINVRSIGKKDLLELSYYVIFKDPGSVNQFVRQLDEIKELDSLNLFFDDEIG
ncbi:DUF4956 domain-containing protein [Candidatus Neomarinimicrobiota bacterium]